MPKLGFIPGEILAFQAIIDNRSSYTVAKVVFQFIQDITLSAKNKTRRFQKTITEAIYPNMIKGNKYEVWNGALLTVPIISCPSSNGLSSIIDINYSVVLKVKPLGHRPSFFASIAIAIGTTPFESEELLNFEESQIVWIKRTVCFR